MLGKAKSKNPAGHQCIRLQQPIKAQSFSTTLSAARPSTTLHGQWLLLLAAGSNRLWIIGSRVVSGVACALERKLNGLSNHLIKSYLVISPYPNSFNHLSRGASFSSNKIHNFSNAYAQYYKLLYDLVMAGSVYLSSFDCSLSISCDLSYSNLKTLTYYISLIVQKYIFISNDNATHITFSGSDQHFHCGGTFP